MKTAAVYIRVSTDGQMEQSPESQLVEIRKFAARNDYLIPDEYIFAEQDGISGRSADKRPEFQRMVGVAKSGDKPFDVILVWKFSRFARNRQDSIIYKRLLRKQLGIEVVSVNENIGTENDGLSELIEAMIEAMDEYYSLNLAEEVKRGMMNKAKNGEPVTHAPFGYKLINKKYVIDEERAAVVRMIFEDFVVNGLSSYLIARKLNNMGVKTNTGKQWGKSGIDYLLNNPIYVGKIRWNADAKGDTKRDWGNNPDMVLVDGLHEPIITIDIWERSREMQVEIARTHKRKQKSSPARALLSGLLFCGNCGSAICGHKADAYQCGSYDRGICRVSHSITRDKIEGLVIDGIDTILAGGDFELAPPPELPRAKSEANVIVAQIKKQEQKLDRIKEAYEAGVYDITEMKKRLAHEQAVLDKLMTATANAAPDLSARKQKLIAERMNIVQVLRSADVPLAEKNALLKTFVDKIVFTRTKPRDAGIVDIFLR